MAVQKKWISANIVAGKKENSGLIMPGQVFAFANTFEVAAADDDGSVYFVGNINANMIPLKLEWNSDAIAGATSYDIGFYTEAGVAVDKDILMAQHDVNAGAAMGSEIDGLHDLPIDKIGKRVYELLGKTLANKEDSYLLAVTANTVGTAAGTISLRGLFIQG